MQKWLANRLRMTMVPPVLWEELVSQNYVWGALDSPSAESFGELEKAARRIRRVGLLTMGKAARGPRLKGARSRSLLSAAEIRRAAVFSKFLGQVAAGDEAVRCFREQVLGGKVLSTTEAHAVLGAPALYLLSPMEFRDRSIPLRDHEAHVAHQREGTTRGRWREHVVLKLSWKSRSKTYRLSIPRSAHDGMWLEVPPPLWGKVTPFPQVEPFVRRGAALDQLRKTCGWLAQRLPWMPWDALWFILTGSPPFVSPIEPGIRSWTSQTNAVETFRRSVLTLAIDPWLSSKSLERVFRAHQKELVGVRNRALGQNALAVFEFVTEREGSDGRQMTWPRLWEAWNRAHPSRLYPNYRNFRGDYLRVRGVLLLPKKRTIRPVRLW